MPHRHWLATAKRCNFPEKEMAAIIVRILGEMDQVIRQVAANLPKGFPGDVATPIFDGMRKARERIA